MSNFYQILSKSGMIGKLHTKVSDSVSPSQMRSRSSPLDDCSTTDDSSSISIFVDSASSTSEYVKQPIIYVPTRSKRDLLSDCDEDDQFDKIWASNMNASTTSSMSDTCDSLLLSKGKLCNELTESLDYTLPAESPEEKYRRYRALQSREHPLKRGRKVVLGAKQDSSLQPSKGRSRNEDLFDQPETKLTAVSSPGRRAPSNILPVDDTSLRRPATKPFAASRPSPLNVKGNAQASCEGITKERKQKTAGKASPFNAPMKEAIQIAFPNTHEHPLPPKKPSDALHATSAQLDPNMSKADRIRELRRKVETNLKQMVATEQLGIDNLSNQVKLFRESSRGQKPLDYEEALSGADGMKGLKAKKILPLSDLYYYPRVINE